MTAEGGTLSLAGAVSGAGTLAAAAGATLDLTGGGSFAGAIIGAGTIRFDAATTLAAGASLSAANVVETANVTLGTGVNLTNGSADSFAIDAATHGTATLGGAAGDTFTNAGTLLANGMGIADIGIAFTNTGTVTLKTGKLAFLGAVSNTGTIDAAAGSLSIKTNVGGRGVMDIGSTGTLSLLHGAKAVQTVDFQSATGGRLNLTHPLDFAGTITGWGGNDIIDLVKTVETGFTFSNGVLAVTDGSQTVASLHFSGSYTQSDFVLSTDGHGGTFISYA